MRGPKKGAVYKLNANMRYEVERRGLDLIGMQMDVYNKAMKAFDDLRGYGDKGDAGTGYLSIANSAVQKLISHSYPTFKSVELLDGTKEHENITIDAHRIRETILNDPFAIPKEIEAKDDSRVNDSTLPESSEEKTDLKEMEK